MQKPQESLSLKHEEICLEIDEAVARSRHAITRRTYSDVLEKKELDKERALPRISRNDYPGTETESGPFWA